MFHCRAPRLEGCPRQSWWSLPRGANWGAIIGNVNNADKLALFLQDVRYAPSKQVNASVDLINASTGARDKWREIDHAALADVYKKGLALEPRLGFVNSDSADLSKLRRLGRKLITYTGLVRSGSQS